VDSEVASNQKVARRAEDGEAALLADHRLSPFSGSGFIRGKSPHENGVVLAF